MPKVMKTCRVCGKSYEACRTVSSALGVFRWQDVACSPACGAIYLQRLNESRGVHTEQKPVETPESVAHVEPTVEPVHATTVEPVEEAHEEVKAKPHHSHRKKAIEAIKALHSTTEDADK